MDIRQWNHIQKKLDHHQNTINKKKAHATVGLFLSHIATMPYVTGKDKWDRYQMMKELRREFSWMFEEVEELSYHDARVK